MCQAFNTTLAIALSVCLLCGSSACADECDEPVWVEVPADGMLSIITKKEELPYKLRDIKRHLASGKAISSRINVDRGVHLSSGQLLQFSTQGTGAEFHDLVFLRRIPADRLYSLSVMTERISAAGLRELKAFSGTRQLHLWCQDVEEFPLLIKVFPSLEYVSFESFDPGDPDQPEGRVFADDVCTHFAGWSDLRAARVCGRRFTDAAVAELAKLPKIEGIMVNGSFLVSDKGVRSLLRAPQLREIVLDVGPSCTDAGVKELLKLENLQWIEIHGMQRVSPATVSALRQRFPDAHIEFKPRVSP